MSRPFLTLALSMLLSGCWTSTAWFAASDAVPVIPEGTYRVVATAESGDAEEMVQITQLPDGALQVVGPERPLRAVVAPLDPLARDDRYIVQIEGFDLGGPDALFLLLHRHGDRYTVWRPPCAGKVVHAVARSGGTVSRDPQSGDGVEKVGLAVAVRL